MFKQRLLTALVLIPLVLVFIFYATSWLLTTLIGALLLGCGLEWLQLIPSDSVIIKIFYLLLLTLTTALTFFDFNNWLIISCILWSFILLAVALFPVAQKIWGHKSVIAVLGLFLLPVFSMSLFKLSQIPHGKELLVYAFFLVWATDIGAYLIGKRWGKHRLIPYVSPKKTIEGAIAGIMLAMLIAFCSTYYFTQAKQLEWLSLALVTILMSMLGDLLISMLKRRCKIKDTGSIFPGHGGLLDRLDSMIAALPIFYFGITSF